MARPATANDIPAMLELGRAMCAEGYYAGMNFDEHKISGLLHRLIDGGFAAVHEAGGQMVGLMIGAMGETWFGRDLNAIEYALYVTPDHRGGSAATRLLDAFTDWAKENGAREITVAQSTGVMVEKTAKFYQRMGFAPMGGVFKLRNF